MLLNTPAAIVLFLLAWYASIGILAAIAALIPAFDDVLPWIDAPDQRPGARRRTA